MAALRLLSSVVVAVAAQLAQQAQASQGQKTTPAASVMLQLVCSVSNETDCSVLTPNLEVAFEPILGHELGVPEELLTVSVACGKDVEGMDGIGQVIVDVLVQIPVDVHTNIKAYNPSAVEDMIGTGENQSHPEDYANEAVQVVTLNVVARGATLTPEGLQQEFSNSSRLTTDVAIESISSPTVELQTSITSSSTSSSVSTSSTSTSALSGVAADTSVLSFSLFITIQGSSSTTSAQAAEAFKNDAEAINALRNAYAANISVDPSTVEVSVTVLTTAGSSLRRRMATAANVEISFRVNLPAESADQVEQDTRALSVNDFQGFVNVALSASVSKDTYASATVESVEDIKVTDADATTTSTTTETVADSSCRSRSGVSAGLVLITITAALKKTLFD